MPIALDDRGIPAIATDAERAVALDTIGSLSGPTVGFVEGNGIIVIRPFAE